MMIFVVTLQFHLGRAIVFSVYLAFFHFSFYFCSQGSSPSSPISSHSLKCNSFFFLQTKIMSSSISRTLPIQPNPRIPFVITKIARMPFKYSPQCQQKKSASDTASKGSRNLPRPLTSSNLSNSASVSQLKVAYQGFPGAYSELAVAKSFPNCETVPCEHFECAFDAVEHWIVDRAVLPFENSIGGSIHRNYDLLLRHKLYIVGEVKYAVRHETDNVTRFLILAREPIIPGIDKPFKTSIVFSLVEGPDVLFKALSVFALRDVTKIESRPHRKKPLLTKEGINGLLQYFNYLYYVDFEASMASQNAQNALNNLKEFATFLRVLGSYPVDLSQT